MTEEKVVPIRVGVANPTTPVRPDVVATLRELLALAEAGYAQVVTASIVCADGSSRVAWAYADGEGLKALGSTQLLLHTLTAHQA